MSLQQELISKRVSSSIPFQQLLLTDLYVFRGIIKDKIINVTIWITGTLIVAGYILPSFGLQKSFGAFLLAGSCASAGLFELMPSVIRMVGDLTGDQVFFYHLTLPLPSWLLIVRHMLYNALNALVLSVIVLPIGKLLLWDQFSLRDIAFGKLALILVIQSLLYGSATILISTFVPSMQKLGNVWMRFIFPFWFLGGYQFSWTVLYGISPIVAYIDLANPVIYIMEGTRAAILGQEGYLNFWLCTGMLTVFCALVMWIGIVRLKRQLDIV